MVVCGGETLGAAVVRACRERLPSTEIWNCYGPAEASIDVTAGRCPDPDGHPPAIGHPLPGAQVLLLDDWSTPVDPGSPGEIHLGGDHLARGYLGDPGGTADRFTPNPYGPGS
jgi:non-ribosomal peptide synthetase component F